MEMNVDQRICESSLH